MILYNWISASRNANSFAPEGVYISNAGTIDGNALDGKQLFREYWDDRSNNAGGDSSFLRTAAGKIGEQYGKELFYYCNMGPDSAVYFVALKQCLKQVQDFRALFQSPNLYNTKRHLTKLGLQHALASVFNSPDDTIGQPLLKRFHCGRGEVFGAHMWQLLVMGSLIGNATIHPKNVSNISKSIIALLLRQSPHCTSPGDKVPILDFNPVTGASEHIIVESNGARPDFFLRPVRDNNFFQTGTLAQCRVDTATGLLPEDVLHCPALQNAAALLHCKMWEVPASFVVGNYSLVLDYPYALYKEGADGVIVIGNKKVSIHVVDTVAESEDFKTLSYEDNWEKTVFELGFIILPMIFRPCAAIWNEERNAIGVIVPQAQVALKNKNFDPEVMTYSVQFEEEKHTSFPALYVVKNLVAVGTEFWLKPSTDVWETLRGVAPLSRQTAIVVRLSLPFSTSYDPTQLYVSVQTRARSAGRTGGAMSGTTVVVRPWDLMMPNTEGFRSVSYVNSI